jgi:hypothetical protein
MKIRVRSASWADDLPFKMIKIFCVRMTGEYEQLELTVGGGAAIERLHGGEA